jgi:hypothetical protein
LSKKPMTRSDAPASCVVRKGRLCLATGNGGVRDRAVARYSVVKEQGQDGLAAGAPFLGGCTSYIGTGRMSTLFRGFRPRSRSPAASRFHFGLRRSTGRPARPVWPFRRERV